MQPPQDGNFINRPHSGSAVDSEENLRAKLVWLCVALGKSESEATEFSAGQSIKHIRTAIIRAREMAGYADNPAFTTAY